MAIWLGSSLRHHVVPGWIPEQWWLFRRTDKYRTSSILFRLFAFWVKIMLPNHSLAHTRDGLCIWHPGGVFRKTTVIILRRKKKTTAENPHLSPQKSIRWLAHETGIKRPLWVHWKCNIPILIYTLNKNYSDWRRDFWEWYLRKCE